jgi:NADH-quinone oxidoreductase subunit G
VHEPKQPQDEESALAFTMEGLNRAQPGSLLPYVWSPGWNSNQSLHKFQGEVGGPLKGGTAGVRLLQPGSGPVVSGSTGPEPFRAEDGQWQLVPRQKIFGSEELSALSPGIDELVTPAFVELGSADAESLGVGCAGFAAGHAGAENLQPLARVTLRRAEGWQRREPQIIGSDGGGGND